MSTSPFAGMSSKKHSLDPAGTLYVMMESRPYEIRTHSRTARKSGATCKIAMYVAILVFQQQHKNNCVLRERIMASVCTGAC